MRQQSRPNRREQNVPTGKIEQAMKEVHEDRRQLLNAKQNPQQEPGIWTLREFTSDIFAYYIELRPYSNSAPVEDLWDTIEVWPAAADPFIQSWDPGEQVTGIDSIADWLNRTQTVKVKSPGLGRGGDEKEVPAFMPPEVLLEASQALDKIAKELGFSIDLPDEYREGSNVF